VNPGNPGAPLTDFFHSQWNVRGRELRASDTLRWYEQRRTLQSDCAAQVAQGLQECRFRRYGTLIRFVPEWSIS